MTTITLGSLHPLGVTPGYLDPLVELIASAPPRLGQVRLVAIDGPSGSGKSRLADELVHFLRAAGLDTGLVRTDDFATWTDPVSWWPRLADGVLTPLAEGRPGEYRPMDWTSAEPTPGEPVAVPVPQVLVCEGVSAGRRAVRSLLSVLVWCVLDDPAARLERAVARDGESSRAALVDWQRFESGWFAVDRPDLAEQPSGGLARVNVEPPR